LEKVDGGSAMKLRNVLKQHSLSYILSVLLGLMMLMIVLVAFLRFAKGNIWVAFSMAFLSTLILSLFLSWVDVQQTEEKKDRENSNARSRMRGRM
jgi:ABC-type antimicrobial peptide transport system permease subunit